jgi:uncharacterized membrane protein (UPF0127 family)
LSKHRFGAPIVAALLLASAGVAHAAPRKAECRAGQPEIRPLQPLVLATDKGRYAFQVEVAETFKRREVGLMCRTAVAADRGMLFDFRKPSNGVAFWMHNTLIPLDIVYIAPDGRVLSIARNAQPLDDTALPAGGEVRGVLEIAGGRAAQIGLLPGDRVLHRIFPK